MRAADVRAIYALDEGAIDAGTPSVELMMTAAKSAAEEAKKLILSVGGRSVAVYCGPGKNGGDGYAVAMILKNLGFRVVAVRIAERMTAEAEYYREKFTEAGGADSDEIAQTADVFVDAMLGVGGRIELCGRFLEAAKWMNSTCRPVLAIDIPSGCSADHGDASEFAVNATVTATFSAVKVGMMLSPTREKCGRIVVCDIGLDTSSLPEIEMIDRTVVNLPVRARNAHKGSFGKTVVIAGGLGYAGAAYFAAQAAVRAGSGLVELITPESVYLPTAAKLNEAMVRPVAADEDGMFSAEAATLIENEIQSASAVVIGPGIGKGNGARAVVKTVLSHAACPVVVDADALNIAAEAPEWLRGKANLVLTPHPGEFFRLTGEKGVEDRLNSAKRAASEFGCTVVLKGRATVVASGGKLYVNTTGNPGMARGGSGDVLAGIVGALLSQGMKPDSAAYTAVWIHGLAGDICAETIGEYGMTPSDMLDALPAAMKSAAIR